MWMAKGNRQELLGEPPAELGQVTLSGDQVGVALAGERRNVVLCLPGGYHWRPSRGETVLVVGGSSARSAAGDMSIPVDATVVGIVDDQEIDESVLPEG